VANRFPVADPHDLKTHVAGELAVKEGALRLFLAEQGRRQADPVHVPGRCVFRPGDLDQRRQPVLESAESFTGGAGLDLAGPADNRWLTEPAFPQRAFAVAQTARRVEEPGIRAGQPLMRAVERAVVTGEDEEGVLVKAQLLRQRHQAADLEVQARYHGGVGGLRLEVRDVAFAARIGRIIPKADILLERIVRHLEREVRHRGRPVKEERPVLVRAAVGTGGFLRDGPQLRGLHAVVSLYTGGGLLFDFR